MERLLYFIAVIPPTEVYDVVKAHQKEMSELFDSHKSYSHIPHITLIPPFRIETKDEHLLVNLINELTFDAFEVEVSGFECFKKHTIYVHVVQNNRLEKIHNTVLRTLNNSELLKKRITYFQKYKPHITIGYRDLEPNFKAAWDYFEKQEIHLLFSASKISLLRHDGEKWSILN